MTAWRQWASTSNLQGVTKLTTVSSLYFHGQNTLSVDALLLKKLIWKLLIVMDGDNAYWSQFFWNVLYVCVRINTEVDGERTIFSSWSTGHTSRTQDRHTRFIMCRYGRHQHRHLLGCRQRTAWRYFILCYFQLIKRMAVLGKNISGAWPLIIWEATTAKRNYHRINCKFGVPGQDWGDCA